jgi:aspartate/methionine/tyrosine aminotransferase
MARTLELSSRMAAVQAPIVAVVSEWTRQTPGTISLGQGVVHYGPPPEAADAVAAGLRDAATHEYQSVAGLPSLRALMAAKLAHDNRIDVDRGLRVMVTAGANMAFMHAVLAVTSPGDDVILPVPFYFNHEMAVQMAGCRVVRVSTDARYQLRAEDVAAAVTDRTRMVVTISPNNPSGAVLDEAALRDVNTLCRERGLYHVSDETYEYFTYGAARHVSPGSFPGASEHTISLYSLSKAYGFAGWRIGYAVYPDHLDAAMLKSQDTILICAPVASQLAAAAALRRGRAYCEPHVRTLAGVRERVVSTLSEVARVRVPAADGAFYCLLAVDTGLDSMVVAERLVREHGVATVPGSAFGMSEGCYLRVAYGALQPQTVAEGIGRLARGLTALAG